jgi:catechol 2,3-dioxygenase-like lactoylglutathione lyase family enzyme
MCGAEHTMPPPDRSPGVSTAGWGPVHHVGVTVVDLDRSVAFWERLVGTAARDRRTMDGPQLGTMVGYEGIRIDSCWVDLPGGVALELLQYLDRDEPPYDPGTAHPGNVHLCLVVDDMDVAHAHAVTCGARPVSERPIDVAAGPRAGSRLAYLRDPDGVTIELLQPGRPG